MFRTRRAIIARRLRATYMNTQLSKIKPIFRSGDLCRPSPGLRPVSGERIAHPGWSRLG